jgi:hypothetical protein
VRARGIDPGIGVIGWCDIERESAGVFQFIACGTVDPERMTRGATILDDAAVNVFSVETPEEMHANDIVGIMRAAVAEAGRGGSALASGLGVGAARIINTVKCLIATRSLAERICCSLAATGVRVVEPTAAECRRALGVRFGAQRGRGDDRTPDQQVKEKIELCIRGWPARSNVHVRDAAAAAFWALEHGARA